MVGWMIRDLLVVGGIPGAGKSTWLRTAPLTGYLVLDSERSAARWRTRTRGRVPYRLLRPLVHAEHHARIARAVLRYDGPVAVHETATRRASRRWLLWLAARGGRRARLHVLRIDAATAVSRQHRRGRVVPRASMERHVARADALLVDAPREGWAAVTSVYAGTGSRTGAAEKRRMPSSISARAMSSRSSA